MAASSKTKNTSIKKEKTKMKNKDKKAKKDDKKKNEKTEQIDDVDPESVDKKTIHFWRPYYLKEGPIKSNEIVFPLMSKTRCIPSRRFPIAGRFRFIKLLQTGPHGLLDVPPVLTLKQRNDAIVKMEGKSDEKKIKEKSKKGKKEKGIKATNKKKGKASNKKKDTK